MTDSTIDQSIACAEAILQKFQTTGTVNREIYTENYPSVDYSFKSDSYRRAHLSIVDARETRKLWMMHCTIFPQRDDPSPIFGFDIIAGPSRVSGAFQDFSCGGDISHPMLAWFADRAAAHSWKRDRELPEWGQRIFSPSMIAIGSVDDVELARFIQVGLDNLDYYLANVGATRGRRLDTCMKQNYYCQNQKLNPHTHRFMTSLGLSEESATKFMNEVLFPEVDTKY